MEQLSIYINNDLSKNNSEIKSRIIRKMKLDVVDKDLANK